MEFEWDSYWYDGPKQLLLGCLKWWFIGHIQFKIKDDYALGQLNQSPRISDPKTEDSFISQVKVSVHQFA